MLQLLSLNMEGAKHLPLVTAFIKDRNPDVICLQEMPSQFMPTLVELGYHVTFRHMWIGCTLAPNDVIGIALASKTTHRAESFYYYGQQSALTTFDTQNKMSTTTFGCIFGTITDTSGDTYQIGVTHLPVTLDGHADTDQNRAVDSLLAELESRPPHLLCGDMNMPRGYNTNYEKFLRNYIDTIPTNHTSSLDRNLHRHAHKPDLNAPIFDIYMVDYIFSQAPYHVSEVQLHFGVSDHAAVTAQIQVA